MSSPNFTTPFPEDVAIASIIYREAEKQAFQGGCAEERIQAIMAADPELDARARRAFASVATALHEKFVALISKRKADDARSPKIFEVHHAKAVAQECFLVHLVKDLDADRALDPEAAAEFTRRRLHLSGHIAEFYAEAGFLPLTPEQSREFGFLYPGDPKMDYEP